MGRVLKRDIILWLIYSVYLLILIFPNLIMPENTVLAWENKLWNACTIIVLLLPAKIVSVYTAVPALIGRIVYKKGKWSTTILKLLISIIFGVILYRLALYAYIYPYIYERSADNEQFFAIGRFLSNFADLTVPMLLFGAIWMYDARLQADQEKTALELQFLKNQTSPHFLFNALNSIFGLVRKNDENAAPALMKLSGILRYLLYETSVQKISLNKELEVIHQYLDIQKLRFGNTLQLCINSLNVSQELMISPGLLLPLLENAFKFGFSDQLNVIFVDIQMEIKENIEFSFVVKNHVSVSTQNEVGGMGLKNLNRRLQLEYPDAHTFESKTEDGLYIAHLKLFLR